MAKEAYYFSHDSNASNDPKMLAMRSVYGTEGYGRYWLLIEMMRDADGYKLDMRSKYSFNAYADHLKCDCNAFASFLNDCIHEFNLFSSDGEHFWSESLYRRMDKAHEKSEKARTSANARWSKRDKNANASKSDTIAHKNDALKESKEKEIKESELTHSTEDDYKKVSKAYAQIHTAMELPFSNGPLLTKMLVDEGIPADHIIGVMKEKFRKGINTLKFYEGAIRDSWNIPVPSGPKLVHSQPVINLPKVHVPDPNILRLLKEAD